MLALLDQPVVMVLVWFFNVHADGRPVARFGPYLTEGTCEAIRARVEERARIEPGRERPTGASPCYKVSVQQTDQISN